MKTGTAGTTIAIGMTAITTAIDSLQTHFSRALRSIGAPSYWIELLLACVVLLFRRDAYNIFRVVGFDE
jgi:hypothetical protein